MCGVGTYVQKAWLLQYMSMVSCDTVFSNEVRKLTGTKVLLEKLSKVIVMGSIISTGGELVKIPSGKRGPEVCCAVPQGIKLRHEKTAAKVGVQQPREAIAKDTEAATQAVPDDVAILVHMAE